MKKIITEKTIISTCTLAGSLACYYYSKLDQRDGVPYVMIGGFVGTWFGEMIAKVVKNK